MKALGLAQVAAWCGGRLHGDDAAVDAVSTDTRTLAADARRVLFVALKGENFDGHAHVADAAARGAVAALVAHEVDAPVAQIVVADTELALGRFANALQQQRKARVLAVTGSNGKTSVKSLLLAILAHAGKV
jgi:UDP-N-acetylmuramoyl-tripeptide--D-alanyl-D-alanine ligase